MMSIRAAIYARVSSEQQATDSTINSQIAALEARLAQDGLSLMPDERFCDEGYSGATLVRPALERLRDAVAAGCWSGATSLTNYRLPICRADLDGTDVPPKMPRCRSIPPTP